MIYSRILSNLRECIVAHEARLAAKIAGLERVVMDENHGIPTYIFHSHLLESLGEKCHLELDFLRNELQRLNASRPRVVIGDIIFMPPMSFLPAHSHPGGEITGVISLHDFGDDGRRGIRVLDQKTRLKKYGYCWFNSAMNHSAWNQTDEEIILLGFVILNETQTVGDHIRCYSEASEPAYYFKPGEDTDYESIARWIN